jgi:hypothetical protein
MLIVAVGNADIDQVTLFEIVMVTPEDVDSVPDPVIVDIVHVALALTVNV